MASRATIWRANQLRYTHHMLYQQSLSCFVEYFHSAAPRFPVLGNEPEGIRTPDPRLRRPLLYPAELQTHDNIQQASPLGDGLHFITLYAKMQVLFSHILLFLMFFICYAALFQIPKSKYLNPGIDDLSKKPKHSQAPPLSGRLAYKKLPYFCNNAL